MGGIDKILNQFFFKLFFLIYSEIKFEKSYLRGKGIKCFSFFPIQCKVFREKVLTAKVLEHQNVNFSRQSFYKILLSYRQCFSLNNWWYLDPVSSKDFFDFFSITPCEKVTSPLVRSGYKGRKYNRYFILTFKLLV